MNFDLDEQQTMLRDLVARFASDRSGAERRTADRRDPAGFARDNWTMLAELGLLALPFAEENDGLGGGAVEIATVAEQLGRGLCIEPWLSDLMLAGRLLEQAGSDAQRDAWIGRIIAGEARLALAHAEPRSRYNPASVACETRVGLLHGTKTFVLAGASVDAYLVSAREGGSAGEIVLWLVRADAAGLERRDYRLTDGSVACELYMHGAEAERLPGDALAALETVFDEARIASCAEMVGIMELLLATTLDHVRTRRQFGQPIGGFQAIQHRMAQLYVRMEQSRSHLYRAMLAPADPMRRAAVAGAKAFISENALKLGEECIQFHGGMGVSDELAIGHGHKRILLLANLFGDPQSELSGYSQLVA
ncbi:acyl-CoA dehydrogenase family protein [Sphingomonas jatrophae]|uniref:Acyl-CoA dehydrogenase n=1 Tax=Sphingomonas jatrophae TaxID=1166337 RepID=A0A1I6M1F8_9SPHN|nr:acyl-CoA dehydrogenase [Sphingomonas jatrophae]SFS09540.1 Acyl-CoA dehydrogenase [Sphingomonas jatrophae]